MDSDNISATDFSDEEYVLRSESSSSDNNLIENMADEFDEPVGGSSSARPEVTAKESVSNEPVTSKNQHLGRKKQLNSSNWKKNVRKLRCNSGKEYTCQKGREKSARTFVPNLECGCPKNCSSQVNETERELFFTSFWNLADYSKQNTFLRGLIKSSKPKAKRVRDGSRGSKNSTFTYSILAQGQNVRVCKNYFLKTLQIGWGRLYRCLSREEVSAVIDCRGKNAKNKKDDSGVIDHISSFPAYQIHYSRKDNPDRKYLNSNLNIRKMYDMYVEKCTSENVPAVKQKFYYKVFSTKFNLHFKAPNKDTCRICDELNMKIKFGEKDESNLFLQKELHLKKAQQARDSLKTEVASNENYVLTFDLQKALPFPKLSTSVAYYKRNMYVYNFGVHSMNTKAAYMYMWNETEGGRGSQKISACLKKHLLTHALEYKYITMYSDACGGQNRNIKLSLSLLKLVGSTDLSTKIIDLKFMESGHSFLPNDANFGVIENRSKKQQFIYSYDDWVQIVKKAKVKLPLYDVIEMERNEFLSTKNLETNITNRKKTVDGHDFSWLKIRWLRFDRNSPFSFEFKETLNSEAEFDTVYLGKAKKGRNLQSLQNVEQNSLYPNRRKVTSDKKRDMMDLLKFIPPMHHRFFKNLPVKEVPTRSQHQDQPQTDEEDENDEISHD